MESDTIVTSPPERPRLPPADIPTAREAAPRDVVERNGIFRSLVSDDSDIAGLVAYSIYKQNKLDWLSAFEAAKGRAPNEAELSSYIIGEGTPRRISIYRHLAEATLSGKGPDAASRTAPRASYGDGGSLSPTAVAAYAVILLVLIIGFWIALHYTVSTH